jgi:hypothetical protein
MRRLELVVVGFLLCAVRAFSQTYFVVGQSLKLYAEGGLSGSSVDLRCAGNGSGFSYASISGYLEDAP